MTEARRVGCARRPVPGWRASGLTFAQRLRGSAFAAKYSAKKAKPMAAVMRYAQAQLRVPFSGTHDQAVSMRPDLAGSVMPALSARACVS